jgi:hypothetical protein
MAICYHISMRYENAMNDNYEMSPLAKILMSVLRKASWIAAALLLTFAGILVLQRRMPDGSFQWQQGDFGFLGVLAAMLLLALYLIRGIKKEMEKPGQ